MRSRRTAGFTLVEMMVVIVIIGLLAAATILVISGRGDKAKVETTKTMISEVSKAVDEFNLTHSRYPANLGELLRKPSDIGDRDWPKGGYLKKEPKDAWGREFVYRVPGTNGQPYDILSLGEDGREGGDGYAADLWNHDAWKR